MSTRGVGALVTWKIDEDLVTTSDHEFIVFECLPLNAGTLERQEGAAQNCNIDRFCGNEQALKAASDHWLELSEVGRRLMAESRLRQSSKLEHSVSKTAYT